VSWPADWLQTLLLWIVAAGVGIVGARIVWWIWTWGTGFRLLLGRGSPFVLRFRVHRYHLTDHLPDWDILTPSVPEQVHLSLLRAVRWPSPCYVIVRVFWTGVCWYWDEDEGAHGGWSKEYGTVFCSEEQAGARFQVLSAMAVLSE
jgi:hypothetical protein